MFKPVFNKVQSDCLIKLDTLSSAVELNISAKEQVSKVVLQTADAVVHSSEATNGVMNFNGRVNVKLLMLNDEGMLFSSSHNADFSDKITSERIKANSKCILICSVVEVDCQANGNVIKIKVIIEVTPYLVNSVDLNCIASGQLCTRKCVIKPTSSIVSTESTFSSVEECKTVDSILRVLTSEFSANITSISVDSETLKVSGNVCGALIYVNTDNKVVCKNINYPYSEEIKALGFVDGTPVFARVAVKSGKIHIDIMEEGVNNAFNADVALTIKAMQITTGEIEAIDDAFSLTNEVALTINSIEQSEFNSLITTEIAVNEAVAMADVGEVVTAFGNRVNVVKSRLTDGKINIEAFIEGTVIYTNSQDKLVSSKYELPFVANIDSKASVLSGIFVDGIVTNILSSKTANGVDIKATVSINVNSYTSNVSSVVTDIKQLEEKGAVGCAIEVCIARRGETLWEIAKSLNIEQEQILEVNPDIVVPLAKDEKIVLYRGI